MCTKHTRASCLSLSGDKKAAMASTKSIWPAPTSLKATVWQHFEFHEVQGRIDKTYTVCKVCGTQLKYSATKLIWETTLRNTIQRLERSSDLLQMPAREQSGRQWHSFSQNQRVKQITKSTANLIALDLRPYSVEDDVGFQTMVFTLEPRYKIPARRYFTDTAIPMLYSETKTHVLDTLMKGGR